MKKYISLFLYYTGITPLLFKLQLSSDSVRIINYHCTPESDMGNFENQIILFKKYFNILDSDQFKGFFKSTNVKPGLIITFDDGLRSNFDFAVKILDKYNITGWFFIPSGILTSNSLEFITDNDIITRQIYDDNRYGINEDEIKILSEDHVIGCHTFNHYRFKLGDSKLILTNEIINSKTTLEKSLDGKSIESFCWVGGELNHYTNNAYKLIKEAGYKFSFTTNNLRIKSTTDLFNLNRTNIESFYSVDLIFFQLSGLMDLFYFSKRRRVNKIFYN